MYLLISGYHREKSIQGISITVHIEFKEGVNDKYRLEKMNDIEKELSVFLAKYYETTVNNINPEWISDEEWDKMHRCTCDFNKSLNKPFI